MNSSPIYIIVGTTEIVYQKHIEENFISEYKKEIVAVFHNKQTAENFISSSRLTKPIKKSYSGTKYFKDGYYDLEIEEHYIQP